MTDEKQQVIQVYASLTEVERRALKAAAAVAGKNIYVWNREALLEKLERETAARSA